MPELDGQSGTDTIGESSTQLSADTSGVSVTELSSFIDKDGSLKDGWKDALLEENYRKEPFYDTVKNVKGIFKIAGDQAKLVGKKGLIPPDETSTPEQRAAFAEALGRPKAPDQYKIEVPQNLKEYYPDDVMSQVRKDMFALDLSQKQVDGIMKIDMNRVSQGDKALRDQTNQKEIDDAMALANAEKAADETVTKMFGEKTEKMINLSNRMIAENIAPERRGVILAAVNDPRVRPAIIELLGNVASKFMEDRLPGLDIEAHKATAQSRIQEIDNTPGFMNLALLRENPEKFKALKEERAKLYAQAYPEGK